MNPVFKRLGNTSKDNYWFVSTLSNFIKLFESILFSQLNYYMKNKFSIYLRKNHNSENSLLSILESLKAKPNNGSNVGVIVMDISKFFDRFIIGFLAFSGGIKM